MKALDRGVETLGLWIVTSSVTFTKSLNQSSIKQCLIVHLVALWTLIYWIADYSSFLLLLLLPFRLLLLLWLWQLIMGYLNLRDPAQWLKLNALSLRRWRGTGNRKNVVDPYRLASVIFGIISFQDWFFFQVQAMIQSIFTFSVSWGKKVTLVVRVRRLEDWAFVDPRFTVKWYK